MVRGQAQARDGLVAAPGSPEPRGDEEAPADEEARCVRRSVTRRAHHHLRLGQLSSCKDDYRDAVQSCNDQYTDPDDVKACGEDAAAEHADCVGD